MRKSTMAYSMLLCCMMLVATLSGVFATWYFAEEKSEPVNKSQNIILSEFVWEPEEILPTVTPGQNYLDLYHSILENIKGGLNSSKDTLEKAVLSDRDGLLHSSQNVQGGNLKHLFITEACRELDFIVEYVTDNEFLLYIYKTADVENGAIGVTRVEVYKTILVQKNKVWEGEETQVGTAVVQFFPNTSIFAIDTSTWAR